MSDDELLFDDRLELRDKAVSVWQLFAAVVSMLLSSEDAADVGRKLAFVDGNGRRHVAATTDNCDADGDKSELKLVSKFVPQLFVPPAV